MEETGAYGERLRKTFKIETAPSFVAKTLKNARIAVTEIRCDKANTGFSEPIPVEDSFLLTVQLRDVPAHGMFIDGRSIETAYLKAGTASFYDLRLSPMADSVSPFHHITFYVPRSALITIAEKEDISITDGFAQNPGVGVWDPTMHNLARAMLPCFRSPGLSSPILIDHVTVAAAAHAVKNYACLHRRSAGPKKQLSVREMAQAQEILAERIGGNLSLDELSSDSGMSPLDFAASFKRTAGSDIHAWRNRLRMDRARRLLARGYDAETTAGLLGYDDATQFVADFKRRTGLDATTLLRN